MLSYIRVHYVVRVLQLPAQYRTSLSSSDGKCKLLTECKPPPFPAAQRLPPMKVSMGPIVPVMSQILTACRLPPIACCLLPVACHLLPVAHGQLPIILLLAHCLLPTTFNLNNQRYVSSVLITLFYDWCCSLVTTNA